MQAKGKADLRSGFTLVELLVVIVIVAALAGLSLAVIRTMKKKSQQIMAVNVIKQVAIANFSYSLDNNNDLNLLDATSVPDSFWGRLGPYLYSEVDIEDEVQLRAEILRRLEALFDTNDATEMTNTFQSGVPIHEDAAGLPVPFAFNNYLNPAFGDNGGVAPKATTFRDKSQIFYFCYGAEWADETDAQEWKELPTGGGARSINIDWFSGKTAAFIFIDGHMEMVTSPVPVRRFTENAGGAP